MNQCCERSQFTRSVAQLQEQLSQGAGQCGGMRLSLLCFGDHRPCLALDGLSTDRSSSSPGSCCCYSSSQPPKHCDRQLCSQLTQPKAV